MAGDVGASAGKGPCSIDVAALDRLLRDLFMATGVSGAAAQTLAGALVDADLEGAHSHGILRAELYLQRLIAGSISTAEKGRVVKDAGAVAVLDGNYMLGHLLADQAMALAVDKATGQGIGLVTCRRGFHFGMAGRYARWAADRGCIGLAMCNTSAMMPAPGGAERLVGNNPIAIGVPTGRDNAPLVLDMALSEAAKGKIRLAADSGTPIPSSWAVGPDGRETTDAVAALAGMLLPVGGPKGFGLALMVDVISGLLAEGLTGRDVPSLVGDPSIPFECSMGFIAIDVGHFRPLDAFRAEVDAMAAGIRDSAKAPGVERIVLPGEGKWMKRQAAGGRVTVRREHLAPLLALARHYGIGDGGLESAMA